MEVMFLPWLSVSGMTQKLDEFCRMFLEVVLASDCWREAWWVVTLPKAGSRSL